MTILRRDCLCFLLRFWKMSQLSSCRSLKPTARWWFSSTDESLYIKASSESGGSNTEKSQRAQQQLYGGTSTTQSANSLVLMRNWLETPGWSTSWMALANRAARISRSVNTALMEKTRRHGKVIYCSGWIITLDCFDHLPPEQVWTVGRGWTGPRLQHGCCCGRPRLHGNVPPKSSWRWWKYPLVSWRTSAAHAPTATDPSLIMTDYCFVRLSDQVIQQKYPSRDDTWKMVYMVTVSGRLPEYSAILKMSIPHLLTSSISCQRATQMHECTREILKKHTHINKGINAKFILLLRVLPGWHWRQSVGWWRGQGWGCGWPS